MMLRLEKVATPLIAFTVVVPLSVPLLGFAPIASVTALVAEVSVTPFTSSIATVTAGDIAVFAPVLVGGETLKASCVADVAVIGKAHEEGAAMSVGWNGACDGSCM